MSDANPNRAAMAAARSFTRVAGAVFMSRPSGVLGALLLAVLSNLSFGALSARAESGLEERIEEEVEPARHAMYVEVAGGMILGASLSLDYEYRFTDHFALSGGPTALGLSAAIFEESHAYYGGRLMARFLVGTGDHRLELAGGVSLVTDEDGSGIAALPNAVVAWRYQPVVGGIVVRLGAMFSNGLGGPIGLSVGGAF